VLYTGESKEIALLEVIVHLPPMIAPQLDIITLEIPDDSITIIQEQELPQNWMVYPAPTVLSEIGENWVNDSRTLAMKVPSCIIQSTQNVVINCRHARFKEVRLIDKKPFRFDQRLVK
ncbi:MAG: RES family NAD+ phosphorylase, partial [Cyclobacteriaceae bacterium]